MSDNPEARLQSVKLQHLELLQRENEALSCNMGSLPIETFERMNFECSLLRKEISEKEKRLDRLKSVFAEKAMEFKEIVYALLGFEIDIDSSRIRFKTPYQPLDIVFNRNDGTLSVPASLRTLLEQVGRSGNDNWVPYFFAQVVLFCQSSQSK